MIGSLAIVRRDLVEQQLHVAGDVCGRNVEADIVRADEQHDPARVERQHVVIDAGEQAARRVAADAAVGDFQNPLSLWGGPGEGVLQTSPENRRSNPA